MATILYTSSHGSDDPTRATIPFVGAIGALDAGHEPQLVLLGEATYLMSDRISDQIDGVGWPPLRELWPKIIEHGVPVYV
ncbi:MAG: hypothetical protein QGD91_12380 [Actinomycetota bacterium]|nr:hypothetical protein [Actinomycetota bacterium]